MKDLLDKLSSYNLFSHLLAGVVFAAIAERMTYFAIMQESIPVGVFVYYFIGLVIGRFGSLVLEPLLARSRFAVPASHEDLLAASEKDPKVALLSGVSNMYRTVCSMFILLLVLKLYEKVELLYPAAREGKHIILAIILLITFAFSYRKQASHIKQRVENADKGDG